MTMPAPSSASASNPKPPAARAHPPIVCIAGATASGKSALALAYAQHQIKRDLPVEIICVDSATIYRGMDIGSAKPSAAEQAICPHHLLDICEPHQSYSAGAFVRDATRLMAEIRARGAEPLLVGGTMLYFKALLEGIDDLPRTLPEIRAAIAAEAQQRGWQALHSELAQIDPETAQRLSPNDSQRISRALEVYRTTGKPLSSYFAARAKPSSSTNLDATHDAHNPPFQNDSGLQGLPDKACKLIALEPQSRQWLHDRIAARFDSMLASGLVDEVRRLKSRSDLHADLPAMRCVGYRQVWEWLEGQGDERQMRERAIAASRQLAKRQLTWLRGWKNKISLPCETAQLADLLAALNT